MQMEARQTSYGFPQMALHNDFDASAVFSKYATPTIHKRPTHRRGRSTRSEAIDIFREIRHVFQRGLTKSWSSSTDFKALARDFYAVSIGLSPGHLIRNYTLNQFQTALLAVELARILNTIDVVLIVDPYNQVLVVCHTQTLCERIDCVRPDETIFVQRVEGRPEIADKDTISWLADACGFVGSILRSTNDQLIQLSGLDWEHSLAKRRMLTIDSWLVDAPLCYVYDSDTTSAEPVHELLFDEELLTFSLRLYGHNAENDHSFEAWQIPASLFNFDPVDQDKSPYLVDGVPGNHTFSSIQDKMQTTMFHQLNNLDLAAKVWADVSITTEG